MNWLKSTLMGAAAAALVLTTTTALAGSGVGGVFNLGQVNTVDAQTSLNGNPGANPLLKVTSTGTAAAVRGVATNGIGTNGVSTSGVGQQGLSNSGIGTLGTHGNATGISPGVQGETNSTDPGGAGVVGKNMGGGPGLRAIVNAGAAPLAVNSQAKVVNLNVDKLDDLDSAALQKRVSGTCAAGSAVKGVNTDGTVVCEPVGGGGVWSLNGNSGTTPGTNFLGTTDNQALELKVNGQRALRLEPTTGSVNVIAGDAGNTVGPGVNGAVIAGGGGGSIGTNNSVTGGLGTVGGGWQNSAGGSATVAGGQANVAAGNYSATGGGFGNTAGGGSSAVAGGNGNTAGGDFSTVGGGYSNQASVLKATVAGGDSNTASGNYAAIGGGESNSAGGDHATIAGGSGNSASASSAIGGGLNNSATGLDTVAGGLANTASGGYSAIGGGRNNQATGDSSVVVGGKEGHAGGNFSTVVGGEQNEAGGNYSFAAGFRAIPTHDGSFVWGDHSTGFNMPSPAANTFAVRAAGGIWLGTSSFPAIAAGHFIDTSTGGYLSTAGAWTNASDRTLKHDLRPLKATDVLEKVVRMPITSWSYKAEKPSVRHIGPMAQDFYKAFGLGLDNQHITTIDEGGVALAAIQGLYRQNLALQRQNRAQDRENAALSARLARLERLLKGRKS